MQRSFAEREGEPLSVRVGLNAGEPIEEDGDLFGATVILASRIAAKAGESEILVADTVRGLYSGNGFLFEALGDKLPQSANKDLLSEHRHRYFPALSLRRDPRRPGSSSLNTSGRRSNSAPGRL